MLGITCVLVHPQIFTKIPGELHMSSHPQNVLEGTGRIIRHPQNIYENTTGITHSPLTDFASNGITRLRGSTPLLPITATVPFCFSLSFQQFNSNSPMFSCVFIVCCAVCFRLLKHFITCTGMTSWTHSTCVAFYKNRFKAIGNGIRRNKSMGCLGFGFRIGRYEQEWDTICEMCDFDCNWPRWKVKYICVCDWIWSMLNVKCMRVIMSMSMWNVTSMIMD